MRDTAQEALRRALAERDEAVEELRQLRAAVLLEEEIAIPAKWRLTRQEQAVFRLLVGRELVTREAIRALALGDFTLDNLISVKIHHLRKKLGPHGVVIVNLHGVGYRLDGRDAWRGKLRRAEG